jgi:hypothetical protein
LVEASETERLEALVGEWHTTGRTRSTPAAPSAEVDATDVYEWLPGRAGLLHRVDARVGEDRVEGAEIIGYDPERQAYVTRYFGNDGTGEYGASLTEEDGEVHWRLRSDKERFNGTFTDDGAKITGHWELTDDVGEWRPWMDIVLTKR